MADEVSTSRGRSGRARRAGLIVAALLAVMVLIQLVPIRVSSPSARADVPWDSARTEQLFNRACADCHSNQAHLQWFEHAAPVSWWIKGHVDEGRDALNVDEYPKVGEGGGEAAETVREGEMPPSYYTWFGMHADAKLTPAEQQELAKGLVATFGRGG
jgi:mono/diheme cytochrome c family protein